MSETPPIAQANVERSQFTLLRERRFGPFFLTQFLGAFNDNVFKNALIILITFIVVMAVVQSHEYTDSGTAHQVVMLRITQTLMGSLVMVLIMVYVYPVRTVDEFEDLPGAIGLPAYSTGFMTHLDAEGADEGPFFYKIRREP